VNADPRAIPCFNRELSWLEFNARVLEEALDPGAPPLDRLRFLSIVSSNLDEFFMVRVAALMALERESPESRDPSGLTPSETLQAISARVREIQAAQYRCLTRTILPELAAGGLRILGADGIAANGSFLEAWFDEQVQPVLTPIKLQADGNLAVTGNLRIHVAFRLRAPDGEEALAIAQVPPNLDRFVRVPSADGGLSLAPLETLVALFGHKLFPGAQVLDTTVCKVTRDADIGVDEDRDDDFVAAMEEVLANRQNSPPVRMTVSGRAGALGQELGKALGLQARDVHHLDGPIDLRGFIELCDLKGFDSLRGKPRTCATTLEFGDDSEPWDVLGERDVLLHHPYESFEPVTRFVEWAASDPDVLAIKMTLYRTSGDSPVVRALGRAARSGKQVTVVVELKARFDEERNIAWASRLEQAGAIVTYGAARLKVHAKACLVIRRERDGSVRRYAHLATGNYNDKTARLYSDLSLLTKDERICRDLGSFFNAITGWSSMQGTDYLSVAPFDLKRRLLDLISREAARSLPGKPGRIRAKMNSLADPDVIEALYRASCSGARIALNVRGVCMLKPGVPGLSDNVRVVSIVGKELEHARIFAFGAEGEEEVFISSADWMSRNLDRRIELMTPVLDPAVRARTLSILDACFADTSKARELKPDGSWARVRPREGLASFSAQDEFARRAMEAERALGSSEASSGEIRVRKKPKRDR
jgi:polyphosphate kinase